jgi:hypothetical protein
VSDFYGGIRVQAIFGVYNNTETMLSIPEGEAGYEYVIRPGGQGCEATVEFRILL